MGYTSAAAFRQALEERLKNEATSSGLGLARLRKRVAFELFLRRLLAVAPDRWVLKGALALDFRLTTPTRSTKDIDESRRCASMSPHSSPGSPGSRIGSFKRF
ncbi:MAG TPA: hypothetical protein VMU55_02025 [Solirubrobacteraceae bacterium]|nr:hypothetical protein [Solirubrobacteraceae bacterium]